MSTSAKFARTDRRCIVCNGFGVGYKRRLCETCRAAVDPTNLLIDRAPRIAELRTRHPYSAERPKVYAEPSLPKFKCLED